MTLRVAAASATVRAWTPTVSCVCEMGTTPARLVSPTVGFSPTTPLAFAGQTTLPSVSVPSDTVEKLAEAAAPEPELEPHGLRSMPYGLCVCPPRPDHPLTDSKERKFGHSDRVVLPMITDRKSTRLNSSHLVISYAVFCLKKKKRKPHALHVIFHHTFRLPVAQPRHIHPVNDLYTCHLIYR